MADPNITTIRERCWDCGRERPTDDEWGSVLAAESRERRGQKVNRRAANPDLCWAGHCRDDDTCHKGGAAERLAAVERELADLRARYASAEHDRELARLDAENERDLLGEMIAKHKDAERRLREATDALRKIAGPWDDLTMKNARTLHYDMAWWAQQALAAVEGTAATPGEDDAQVCAVCGATKGMFNFRGNDSEGTPMYVCWECEMGATLGRGTQAGTPGEDTSPPGATEES